MVFPKKYSKKGLVASEEYIAYMCERIEFYAQVTDKRVLALEKRCTELEAENKALKEKLNG